MIRDTLRACLVVATLAACASIVLKTRQRLLVMAHADRLMASHAAPAHANAAPTPPTPPGRLQGFGRAVVNLADAALAVVR